MSYRISTNIAALTAQRFLEKNQRSSEKAMMALASGSRINRAGDDAAGFAISESLRGQLSGTKQAKFNAENAVSLIQTAEGGLSEQNNILIRLRELAVYAASDTIGDEEREFLDKEFQQLTSEFDRIAKATRFGNKELLTGTGEEFEFHIGAYKGEENVVKFKLDQNTSAQEVGIDTLTVMDQDDAVSALEDIDKALLDVAGTRATFGAMQSRFQHSIDHLSIQAENLDAARSQIVDADIAEEVTQIARNNILTEAGTSVLAQANQNTNRIMRLIG